jgi:4-alpha-glucanotransferase
VGAWVPRAAMARDRSSGILLHLTSLPSGKLDEEAYRFVDWLAAAGQSWWQILPLGPPDETGSPYRAASAFAAWNGFLGEPDAPVTADEIESYVARHPYWIGSWAEFAGEDAVADQVRFEREWGALRAYAKERGVGLIGDLPIYVAPGGADERGWPELFQRGRVSGVPPDDWSATGQLWGNPLYDWATMRSTNYRWWVERFRRTFELVDVTRIDHFRAFVAYWAVSAKAKTAKRGVWRRGPGRALFDAAHAQLGELDLIAEDLGTITPPVEQLREDLNLPGMLILHFMFAEGMKNPQRPGGGDENRVVYTGTHDNDTTVGWWESASESEREHVRQALDAIGMDDSEPHWGLIELALRSAGYLSLIPAQDVLGLGSDARMNMPGQAQGNWSWRLERGQLTDALARRLRERTSAAGR